MPSLRIPGGLLLVADEYKPGDPAPEGYLAWHEWAAVQHKAGLRQEPCGQCGKWKYPQEISRHLEHKGRDGRGQEVIYKTALCCGCDQDKPA